MTQTMHQSGRVTLSGIICHVRLKGICCDLGLVVSTTVSLHSFHGSRGAPERAQGIPATVTCADMVWSMEMYIRYTENRVPFSVLDLRVGKRQLASTRR